MSALLTPPLLPPARADNWPRRVPEFAGERWTVAEFHAMEHPERFEGRRLFLIRGEIWEQGRMNPPHAGLLNIVNAALQAVLPPATYVRMQQPLLLGQETDPQPDLAVVAGRMRDHLIAHPTTALLVVEIADSTLFNDTTTKAESYAEANVADYWVVDVNNRKLLVFRDPAPVAAGGHAYRTALTFEDTDTVSPLFAPSSPIRVADLLP